MPENQLGGVVPQSVLDQRTRDNQQFLSDHNMKFVEGKGIVAGGGASDHARDRMVREKWQQLYRVGWEMATVINCLPWPLSVQTTFGYFTVPAPDKKKNEAFKTFEVRVPSIDMRDLGDGKYVPEVIMPIEIAQEFEKKYQREGGVIVFTSNKDGSMPENIGALLEQAQERMVTWYKEKYTEGQANWALHRQNPHYIDERMRDSARYLYAKGLIPELPPWISTTRDEATQTECPACGEVVKKTAKICVHCRYEIDPAFVAANRERMGMTAIEEENRKPKKKDL